MNENPRQRKWPDWRVTFGMVVTALWIFSGCYYLFAMLGWRTFVDLPTGEIGSFLEGAFAPLAFLWLVIGHFMQQTEISSNTKAINLQERSAQRLEQHTQRETYFKLLTLVQDQLGSIAAFHYYSITGPTGDQTMSSDEFSEARARANNGDHAVFVRLMTVMSLHRRDDPEGLRDIYLGTDVRRRHTENYVRTFEKLRNAAYAADTDEMISNALLYGSAVGRLYHIILFARGDIDELELF